MESFYRFYRREAFIEEVFIEEVVLMWNKKLFFFISNVKLKTAKKGK